MANLISIRPWKEFETQKN